MLGFTELREWRDDSDVIVNETPVHHTVTKILSSTNLKK